jgi:hypothetical protein
MRQTHTLLSAVTLRLKGVFSRLTRYQGLPRLSGPSNALQNGDERLNNDHDKAGGALERESKFATTQPAVSLSQNGATSGNTKHTKHHNQDVTEIQEAQHERGGAESALVSPRCDRCFKCCQVGTDAAYRMIP